MNPYVWTISLAIVSQVAYHVGQKSVPRGATPFLVLAIAYAGAFLLCVVGLAVSGSMPSAAQLRASAGWPTWVLVVSVLGIEIGFLLAYRSGWPVNLAFAVASTASVVALALLGTTFFGNPLTARRALGLALACVSLWLLVSGGQQQQ